MCILQYPSIEYSKRWNIRRKGSCSYTKQAKSLLNPFNVYSMCTQYLFKKYSIYILCTLNVKLEMFYLNSTLNFGIPPVLVFQLEVYYKVDRLLTGLTAQQKGTTA